MREKPQMADSTPSQTTLEGASPQTGIWPEPTTGTKQSERKIFPGARSEYFHGVKS